MLVQLQGEEDLHSDRVIGEDLTYLVTWEQRPGGLWVSVEGQVQNSEAEACGACSSCLGGWKGVNWRRSEVARDPILKGLFSTAGTLAFSRHEEGSLWRLLSKGGVI